MTNCCMVLPEPGFHAELRRLTRAAGTLLLIDETHTISTGPGGYTGAHGLEPDLLVLGKPVAGGVPASVWGFTEEVAQRLDAVARADTARSLGHGHDVVGQRAVAGGDARHARASDDAAGVRAHGRLAARLAVGLQRVIDQYEVPWHVVRVGARVEFICAPGPLRNGTEAEAAHAPALEQAIHLALLNRGCLIAPFHNMMLVSPATTAAQVATLCDAFESVTASLALDLESWQ